jgi:translation initiation factor 1A
MSEENREFGDFEEIKEEGSEQQLELEQQVSARIRMPRGKELIGVILQRYGGNRMEVHCSDGKTRNCRVPGRYRRRLWLRPKDTIIIIPWEDDDNKGDIIFKYHKNQGYQLKKKGILDFARDDF